MIIVIDRTYPEPIAEQDWKELRENLAGMHWPLSVYRDMIESNLPREVRQLHEEEVGPDELVMVDEDDQDDMIASLGLYHGGRNTGGGIGHARVGVRSDNLTPRGTRLRYISCPFTPFNNYRKAQNVCGVI